MVTIMIMITICISFTFDKLIMIYFNQQYIDKSIMIIRFTFELFVNHTFLFTASDSHGSHIAVTKQHKQQAVVAFLIKNGNATSKKNHRHESQPCPFELRHLHTFRNKDMTIGIQTTRVSRVVGVSITPIITHGSSLSKSVARFGEKHK